MRKRPFDTTGEGRGRWLLLGVLGIGLGFRLVAFVTLPVAHDEIQVVAYGLSRVALSGSARELLFDTPFTVSNGITPLWFWLQAIPAATLGTTSKLGLRILPMLLGLIGVWLAFRAGRLIGGLRTAWFSGLAYACMSLMLYTNGRGEFAESLIAPLILALLIDLLPLQGGMPPPLRAALWPGLILFTYAGKGLLIWGLYTAYLTISWLLFRRGHRGSTRDGPAGFRGRRLVLLIALPLIPSLVWLVAAQAILFGNGGPVFTDIGPVSSVWACIWKLTAGYGTDVKEFMVGGPGAALYPYADYDVWPILSLMTVPSAMAVLLLGAGLLRALRRRDLPTVERMALPLILALPPFLLLVAKGAYSARFHLLYIPVILPYAARAVDGWIGLLESGEWKRFFAGGAAASLYVAWTLSWADPLHGSHDWRRSAVAAAVMFLVLAAVTFLGWRSTWRPRLGIATAALLTLVILGSAWSRGVLDWGKRLAWEPELRERLPDPIATMPNAELQLARYFIQRELWLELNRSGIGSEDREGQTRARTEVVRRGRPLLIEALDRNPDDPATMKEAGAELYRFNPEDRPMVVSLWRSYALRHPGDQEIRSLLGQAGSLP